MQALSNVELSYIYSNGGAVTFTISDGKLSYLWTAGPFEGNQMTDLNYTSWEVDDSTYVVSWNDTENKNFVSLIFNLDEMKEYGTALISYGTPQEATIFDQARIEKVTWLD